jgi:hypothetical protein
VIPSISYRPVGGLFPTDGFHKCSGQPAYAGKARLRSTHQLIQTYPLFVSLPAMVFPCSEIRGIRVAKLIIGRVFKIRSRRKAARTIRHAF